MNDDNRDPLLLTPGPLTTSAETKQAASRLGLARSILYRRYAECPRRSGRCVGRRRCVYGGTGSESGTFAVEAMVRTFLPKNRKLLIVVNRRLRPPYRKDLWLHSASLHGLGDAGGHAARCRCHLADARGRPRYQSCRRNSLRDDIRHPESGRRHCGGRCRREPPLVDRCNECLRGDSPQSHANLLRCRGCILQQVLRGCSGHGLRPLPKSVARRDERQRPFVEFGSL